MNTAPDAETTETEPVNLVKEAPAADTAAATEPATAKEPADAEGARPASDILGRILDEHPEWEKLLYRSDPVTYVEPVFLDDEPSLRNQFKQAAAANAVAIEADQRNLEDWQHSAWERVKPRRHGQAATASSAA